MQGCPPAQGRAGAAQQVSRPQACLVGDDTIGRNDPGCDADPLARCEQSAQRRASEMPHRLGVGENPALTGGQTLGGHRNLLLGNHTPRCRHDVSPARRTGRSGSVYRPQSAARLFRSAFQRLRQLQPTQFELLDLGLERADGVHLHGQA